jgi:hypothetical protein
MPIIAKALSTDFVIGQNLFADLEIRRGNQNDFYYFHNTKQGLVKHFVLKNTKLIQKRCHITLIRKEDGNFEPRFDFDILDVKKACPEQFEMLVQEKETRLIKAKVDLSDCHDTFSQLLTFLEGFPEISRQNQTFAVVSLDEKEQLSRL